jgi:hypothetical protein
VNRRAVTKQIKDPRERRKRRFPRMNDKETAGPTSPAFLFLGSPVRVFLCFARNEWEAFDDERILSIPKLGSIHP